MTYKKQKKMYVLSGGMSPEDSLDKFRYMTKGGMGRIPRGYINRIFDEALEVDVSGIKKVEFDRCDGDDYWSCCDHVHKLKDARLARVAFIDGRWRKLDIDPYADAHEYLESNGYRQKLGCDGGWFSPGKVPTFKQLAFDYFATSGRNNVPEFDLKEDRYAGVYPDARHDEIKIYNGVRPNCMQVLIGQIRVEDDTIVIHMHDDVYRFSKETDEDFIRWSTMCIRSFIARSVKKWCDAGPDGMARDSKDKFREALNGNFDLELEIALGSFRRQFAEYYEQNENGDGVR